MFLRKLVQARLESSFKIYNREGILIPENTARSEYQGIRQYLLDHVTTNECIFIKQTKDYRYLLTMLACMEIGIPYIPSKYDIPEDRIAQIKEDSRFSLLIDDQNIQEIVSYQGKKKDQLPQLTGDETVYIIFTSGTTGRPKGVVIQRKALENFFTFMGEAFPKISEKDRLLQVAEFSFDQSVLDLALFLTRNVEFYFSSFGNNIFKFGHEIETYRITTLNTVPNNLNMFLSDMVAERMDYSCLKHLFIGGARFSYGLYQKCLKYFQRDVEINNLYGPTEATVYSHWKKITYQDPLDCIDGVVSIGDVLPNTEAHIVVDGQIVGPNTKGELYIGGIQLLKEYINNPAQTEKAIVTLNGKTYYRTGDLAFRTESNEYFIVGRADETIKYRGFRINLLDIDSYISRLPYVQDSMTIAVPNEITENQTVGFVILKEQKTLKELKGDLSKVLLDYQIPEKIIFVDKFPTNNSGKVCRKTMAAEYIANNKV